MGYIDVPVATDPTDLAEEAFAYIETNVPGWLPSPANLEAWLVESLAQVASELRTLITLVPESIFRYYGATVLGLPPIDAVAAGGTTTWTALDTAGYAVPAGTLLAITPPASYDSYAFETTDDFTFPFGQTVVANVAIRAIDPGAAASGLTGTVQPLDQLDFISTITLNGATSGGQDAETDDAYLARLSDLLTLLAPRPILPKDFALLAQANPSVARATAIDGYNASTSTANVPRCVTVVLVDDAGNAVPAQVKSDVLASLQAQREVNFLVFVADPTYTTIDVQFTVTCYAGNDPTTVANAVIAQLQSYLSPGQWGAPEFGDPGSTLAWINDTHVWYLEVSEQINRVDGVHRVVTLQTRIAGGTFGTTDITMPGVAPLPRPGAITGTATVG